MKDLEDAIRLLRKIHKQLKIHEHSVWLRDCDCLEAYIKEIEEFLQ